MLLAGGRTTATYLEKDEVVLKTSTVVMPDGSQCNEPILPDLPEALEGFGMASKKDRYIYVCGGIERSDTCTGI